MFQTQSLPSGNGEHASIAHGRAVLGRDAIRWVRSWDSGGTWPVTGQQ